MIDNDFGFSATTEQDIIQRHVADNYQPVLDTIWNAINPLLTNLQKDPDKDVLKWPGRADAIKKLQVKIKTLCNQS